MRSDSIGLFWSEVDARSERKIVKLKNNGWLEHLPGYWIEKSVLDEDVNPLDCMLALDEAYLQAKKINGKKAEPPEPTWLLPDYLPHYAEAYYSKFDYFTDEELLFAGMEHRLTGVKHELVYDIEIYPNYFLAAFKSLTLGKIVCFEISDWQTLDAQRLLWVLENFTTITFNGNHFDIPLSALAVNGKSVEQLAHATHRIINEKEKPWMVLRSMKVKKLYNIDTIDIKEVAPLSASLKVYGGRIHSRRLQDLPFDPATKLTPEQIVVMRWYCVNDLDTTIDLYNSLKKEMDLRRQMSVKFGGDLRSKSDAQIAEAVLGWRIEEIKKARPKKPTIEVGTVYHYRVPEYLSFESDYMNYVLDVVRNTEFVVSESGDIKLPQVLKDLEVKIGNTSYTLGIGGLHSTEKSRAVFANDNHTLEDWDVESYYPRIILNQRLYPMHLGPDFLYVYEDIVDTRLAAKHAGNESTSNSLKIVINGSFGKLGSKHSILYAPDLLIQTTISGQLSLLMLIEALELRGVPVVSANTDGIVIRCPEDKQSVKHAILEWWQQRCNFKLECTAYDAVYSRDVNNYIAIKSDKKKEPKVKGSFTTGDLSRNPTCDICTEAVTAYLKHGTPLQTTITQCTTVSKFVALRKVNGGAVHVTKEGNNYLGGAIRWYYSQGETGQLVYAKTGNKVAKSDGGKPLMLLPDQLPEDLNYNWYIQEAESILKQVGVNG